MSVLNQASDGLFNVLIVLVRALVRFGPRSREDLLRACGAEVAAVDPAMLTRTLNRWTELGLFAEKDDLVGVAEPYATTLGRSADAAEARLPKVVRQVSLMPQNNERFWEAGASKSADLSRGVSWMLAQDIYTLNPGTKELAALETRQLADKDKPIVRNDTRWNGLRAWMTYLGYAREGGGWNIDPSTAVLESLPEIFGGDPELSAPVFVARAAALLPVLDGGAYRLQVEAALNASTWVGPRDRMASMSLSRAIQRLDRVGHLKIERKKSDSEGVLSLTGYQQRIWREISHLRPSKPGKAR